MNSIDDYENPEEGEDNSSEGGVSDCDTRTTISTQPSINIDENSALRLRQIIQGLTEAEEEIQKLAAQMANFREKRTTLRDECMNFMKSISINEVALKGSDDIYRIRHRKQKRSPLTKTKLPDSLSRYFIVINKDSIEDAKRRATDIIDWITKNIQDESIIQVLCKCRSKLPELAE